jgi:hypothetical protein
MRRQKGGFLLDAFLIVAMLAGAMWLWLSWREGRLPGFLRGLFPAAVGEVEVDANDRGAWLQAQVRELLAKHGVDESSVVKTYTQQKRDGGVQWLEDTLEIKRPVGFRTENFLRDLSAILKKGGLQVMRDQTDVQGWILELGDKRRVYERIIFVR